MKDHFGSLALTLLLALILVYVVVYGVNKNQSLKAELEQCQTDSACCQSKEKTYSTGCYTDSLDYTLYVDSVRIVFETGSSDTLYIGTQWHYLYPEPKSKNMLYNYATKRVAYESELTDIDAVAYIPQHKVALDTYRWYREVKGYSVRKSIRLTERYWTLNLNTP